MTTWKDIPDYPNYEVSDKGDVRNKKRRKILKPSLTKGYHRVVLCDHNVCRPKTVHRLVAEVFHEGDHEGLMVNHIDGNKLNNCTDNLEWVTASENLKHAYDHNLRSAPCPNPRKVKIIETGEIFDTASSCARHINGTKQHVCECMNGSRQTHKGYHFKEIFD